MLGLVAFDGRVWEGRIGPSAQIALSIWKFKNRSVFVCLFVCLFVLFLFLFLFSA